MRANSKVTIVRENDHIRPLKKQDLNGKPFYRNGKEVFISETDYYDLEAFVKEYEDFQDLSKNPIHCFSEKQIRKKQVDKDDDFEDVDRFFGIGKNKILIKNYVGAIQLPSGLQIDILPKIELSNEVSHEEEEQFKDAAEKRTREIFLKMLSSMPEFPFKVFEKADLAKHNMSLMDIFIYLFLQELYALTRAGLNSKYLREEDNLPFFKGKLLLAKHININATHNERFYVEYDEYSVNRPENRLLKAALLKAKKISTHQENQRLIYQLVPHFDAVDTSSNYQNDFSQVVKDRSTKAHYDSLMVWADIVLNRMGISTFAGNKTVHSILFKMNDLFESFVYKEFRKAVNEFRNESEGPLSWAVQKKGGTNKKHLYDNECFDDNVLEKPKFRLEPDIVIRSLINDVSNDSSIEALLDTKWKALVWNKVNHGISNADMYQMFAYSQKYNTKNIWLLYPKVPKDNWHITKNDSQLETYNRVSFESKTNSGTVYVRAFFVDLVNIQESMDTLVNEMVRILKPIKVNLN